MKPFFRQKNNNCLKILNKTLRPAIENKSSICDLFSKTQSKTTRLTAIFILCLIWTFIIVSRLFELQVSDVEKWKNWAKRNYQKDFQLASERGSILDRNNRPIAISVPSTSLFVRTNEVADKESTIIQLAKLLGIDEEELRKKMYSEKPFIWLKRQMSRQNADKILQLKIVGVGGVPEAKRMYPYNKSASSIIGRVGIDGTGLSGIEGQYEKILYTRSITSKFLKDAMGKMIHPSDKNQIEFNIPKGHDVKLSIDIDIQGILDEEVERAKENAKAKAAFGLIINSDTR